MTEITIDANRVAQLIAEHIDKQFEENAAKQKKTRQAATFVAIGQGLAVGSFFLLAFGATAYAVETVGLAAGMAACGFFGLIFAVGFQWLGECL